MAEIRINATGGVKLYDADDSHYAQIIAGTITSNTDVMTLGHNVIDIPMTTASSSATTGALTIGGGLGVAADLYVGDDTYLITDSAVLGFGADKDTTLTHTDGTGLTLNSTNKLCFNDATQFVQGSSGTVLSIGATDEIDLTATAIDINGTCDISGTFSLGGTNLTTTAAEINLIDGGTSRGTTALADGDGILINDAGTMRMTNVTAVKTYMATAALAGIDDQTSSNDDQLTIADSEVCINEDSDDLDFRVESNGATHMLFADGGTNEVGINTSSPANTFHVVEYTTTGTSAKFTSATNSSIDSGAGTMRLQNTDNRTTNRGPWIGFEVSTSTGSDGVTEDGSCIACVAPNSTNANRQQEFVFRTRDSGTAEHFRIAADGTLTATDTSIGSNSDSRLKDNISDYTYDLAKFKQFQPRTFTWRNPEFHNAKFDESDNQIPTRGFVAQELNSVDNYWTDKVPLNDVDKADYDLIPANLDGDHKAYTAKLGKKDAMYISVINQLIARIEALEA